MKKLSGVVCGGRFEARLKQCVRLPILVVMLITQRKLTRLCLLFDCSRSQRKQTEVEHARGCDVGTREVFVGGCGAEGRIARQRGQVR